MKLLLAILCLFLNGFGSLYARTYSTSFSSAENPISENANWINGATNGLDWTNVRTSSGMAFGTQSGTATGNARYADSTAVLAGTWKPNQTAQATVAVHNASGTNGVNQEVEIRLRTTITQHSITGYEILASVSNNPNSFYVQIIRWNGPLGSFTFLDGRTYHIANGDVLKGTVVGNVITLYVNGTERLHVTDNTYNGGSPGIGFFVQGGSGLIENYGFSNFSASDDGSPTSTPGPTATPSPTPVASKTPYAAWETSLISEMRAQRIRSSQINAIESWMASHPPYR